MKANELRIGNWVHDGFQHFQITAQDIFIISDKHNGLCIVPVELTEEWLLKFGFEKHYDFVQKNLNDIEWLSWRKEIGLIFHKKTIGATHRMPHINYVHQLQNLYFALTGEELTVNEK